ncbi:hypothetical protein MPSEU_000937100 [Mayamaea pseudoterrestris]|nr:hypothetical protein MPSEU_000937100 [Mayamaea pseudoterrestris]
MKKRIWILEPFSRTRLITLVLLARLEHILSFSNAPVTFVTSRRISPSQSTIHPVALQVSPEPLTSAIDSFFQTQPYIAAFLTCSFKAGTADLVAQSQLASSDATDQDDRVTAPANSTIATHQEKSNSLDLARNVAFIVYGGIYQGLFQEFLYGHLFPAWFGNDGSFQTVATSVLADQIIFAPFACLPCAYIIKAFVMNSGDDANENESSDAPATNGKWSETAIKGLGKYKEDVLRRGLLIKYWGLWTPVQTVTFSVVPERYRILFIACVSFFWMFLLSAISSDTSDTTAKETIIASTTFPDEEPIEVVLESASVSSSAISS